MSLKRIQGPNQAKERFLNGVGAVVFGSKQSAGHGIHPAAVLSHQVFPGIGVAGAKFGQKKCLGVQGQSRQLPTVRNLPMASLPCFADSVCGFGRRAKSCGHDSSSCNNSATMSE